jgi:cupin fold WbuC family metalloprotein
MKLTRVDDDRLERAVAAARASPRLRMNDNLHLMEDAVHRLLNATEPGTYVQPHRHSTPPKTETLCLLRGRGAILVFDDDGTVIERAILAPGADCRVIEIPPATWHTLIAIESGTVWFEVKEGPYAAPPVQDVAPWSPAPNTEAARSYLDRLRAIANAGDARSG